jgi:hypothetical protein
MSTVEKLFALLGIARGAYGRWLLHRLMSGIILVAGLTIIATMMIGALLIGGFYTLYVILLEHQVSPEMAFLLVGGMGVLISVVLITVAMMYLRRMYRLFLSKPVRNYPSQVVDAFFDGLLSK